MRLLNLYRVVLMMSLRRKGFRNRGSPTGRSWAHFWLVRNNSIVSGYKTQVRLGLLA